MSVKYEYTPAQVLDQCLEILAEYEAQGLKLTLRQMYYRLVATGLSPNGQKAYKRLGSILTAARYAGSFPADGLEDRGRTLNRSAFERNETHIEQAMMDAARTIRSLPWYHLGRDRWYGQRAHVSVWVEKEALLGIFEPVCEELGVNWMACKGYPSVSALNSWVEEVGMAEESGVEEAVVIYFGDHDPDGWEIPRSSERGIESLNQVSDRGFDIPIILERVALNMDQILRYDPPPFPAKLTSARYAGYVAEHDTDSAWELDALEPTVLRGLIRKSVKPHFDDHIYRENLSTIEGLRDEMRERLADPEWVNSIW